MISLSKLRRTLRNLTMCWVHPLSRLCPRKPTHWYRLHQGFFVTRLKVQFNVGRQIGCGGGGNSRLLFLNLGYPTCPSDCPRPSHLFISGPSPPNPVWVQRLHPAGAQPKAQQLKEVSSRLGMSAWNCFFECIVGGLCANCSVIRSEGF